KGREFDSTELIAQEAWSDKWLLSMARAKFADGAQQGYLLPLALAWEDAGLERIQQLLHCTLARVRQRARVGILYDAFWDDDFCLSMVDAMGHNVTQPLPNGRIVYSSTSMFKELVGAEPLTVTHPAFEQSNSLAILGLNKLVLKVYRQVHTGINPEIEIG